MTFQSVPGVVEAVARMTINGQEVTMTFYGLFASGYVLGDVQSLAGEMDAWAATWLIPRISLSATYDGFNCRGLELENDYDAFNDTSAGAGTVASQPTPNNVAAAIKRQSIYTGRSARGRVYFPLTLASIDSTDENRISASVTTQLENSLNQVRVSMAVAGATEVIVSRYNAGAKRAVGVTFPVSGYTKVTDVLNTQRRRLPTI